MTYERFLIVATLWGIAVGVVVLTVSPTKDVPADQPPCQMTNPAPTVMKYDALTMPVTPDERSRFRYATNQFGKFLVQYFANGAWHNAGNRWATTNECEYDIEWFTHHVFRRQEEKFGAVTPGTN